MAGTAPAPVHTSDNIIAGWWHAVNSFVSKRGNKYLQRVNSVNIAAWECESHCALQVKGSQLL